MNIVNVVKLAAAKAKTKKKISVAIKPPDVVAPVIPTPAPHTVASIPGVELPKESSARCDLSKFAAAIKQAAGNCAAKKNKLPISDAGAGRVGKLVPATISNKDNTTPAAEKTAGDDTYTLAEVVEIFDKAAEYLDQTAQLNKTAEEVYDNITSVVENRVLTTLLTALTKE